MASNRSRGSSPTRPETQSSCTWVSETYAAEMYHEPRADIDMDDLDYRHHKSGSERLGLRRQALKPA
ncbi:hypothetical protein F4810DRAFT_707567 [Camillea tinctor]|nr:hypothetical protein F4810DRAFT_707567 [Camillea tinctor]